MNYVIDCLRESWFVLTELAPWLLLGLLVAGLIHILLPKDFLRHWLGRRRMGGVFWAALFGVPMPLCSCGVIPASIGLKKEGASDGAAVAFLISTPQTGVDSILVSATFLGWPFALFKVGSAFVTGLLGGGLTNIAAHDKQEPEVVAADEPPLKGVGARVRELFRFAFGRLLGDIYRWVIIGVITSGILTALLPENYFADVPWARGFAGMLVMLVIALPLYVCATSSVPIAASLVRAGLPPGAALVFLMAGPATNVATLGAIFRTFGKRVTVIYVLTVAVSSLIFGSVFNFVVAVDASDTTAHLSHVLPNWKTWVATGILLCLLAGHAYAGVMGKLRPSIPVPAPAQESLAITVEGMTCQHCANSVRKAIESLAGVSSAVVDLKTERATLYGRDIHLQEVADAVHKAGYGVGEIPQKT